MIRKAGASMSVIAQEMVYEAKKKVAEMNFDQLMLFNERFHACKDKGKFFFCGHISSSSKIACDY